MLWINDVLLPCGSYEDSGLSRIEKTCFLLGDCFLGHDSFCFIPYIQFDMSGEAKASHVLTQLLFGLAGTVIAWIEKGTADVRNILELSSCTDEAAKERRLDWGMSIEERLVARDGALRVPRARVASVSSDESVLVLHLRSPDSLQNPDALIEEDMSARIAAFYSGTRPKEVRFLLSSDEPTPPETFDRWLAGDVCPKSVGDPHGLECPYPAPSRLVAASMLGGSPLPDLSTDSIGSDGAYLQKLVEVLNARPTREVLSFGRWLRNLDASLFEKLCTVVKADSTHDGAHRLLTLDRWWSRVAGGIERWLDEGDRDKKEDRQEEKALLLRDAGLGEFSTSKGALRALEVRAFLSRTFDAWRAERLARVSDYHRQKMDKPTRNAFIESNVQAVAFLMHFPSDWGPADDEYLVCSHISGLTDFVLTNRRFYYHLNAEDFGVVELEEIASYEVKGSLFKKIIVVMHNGETLALKNLMEAPRPEFMSASEVDVTKGSRAKTPGS